MMKIRLNLQNINNFYKKGLNFKNNIFIKI
jgi:hypothetical protein